MPEYACHKRVWALKIAEVIAAPKPTIAELEAILEGNVAGDVQGFIVPAEKRFAAIPVPGKWLAQHDPQPGGYLVFYKDGYRSYSPAAAFEEGYTLLDGSGQSPEAIQHEGAGNLAFLLSVIRCGEKLSDAEEVNVRRVIGLLNGRPAAPAGSAA
jgi:hypothetical protein